jgi:hypothetical protein
MRSKVQTNHPISSGLLLIFGQTCRPADKIHFLKRRQRASQCVKPAGDDGKQAQTRQQGQQQRAQTSPHCALEHLPLPYVGFPFLVIVAGEDDVYTHHL